MKSPHQKGNRHENRIAHVLSEWWTGERGHLVRNEDSGSKARLYRKGFSGMDAADVVPHGEPFFWPFFVECKCRQGWNFHAHMKNPGDPPKETLLGWWMDLRGWAEKADLIPLLFFTRNYDLDYVMLEEKWAKPWGLLGEFPSLGLHPQGDYSDSDPLVFDQRDFISRPREVLEKSVKEKGIGHGARSGSKGGNRRRASGRPFEGVQEKGLRKPGRRRARGG